MFSTVTRQHSSYFSIWFFFYVYCLIVRWFYGIGCCNVSSILILKFHTFAISRRAFELISARARRVFVVVIFRTFYIANDTRSAMHNHTIYMYSIYMLSFASWFLMLFIFNFHFFLSLFMLEICFVIALFRIC